MIEEFVLNQEQSFKELRYFVCYNFGDQSGLNRQRIFYCYYLNVTGLEVNDGLFDRIEN